ncbi:MAG TPA: helix-turn-helix domain-containing protein [Burkholderiaceae bacterium]|jgi:AcrR family transcriptional regulator|nr:helix-turn-helix domain-containing protein [Burkholderiaceae bacterium]
MSVAALKSPPAKRSFREQMHLAREDAIIQAVNRLLAEKGFDAMTVDEVAAEVGIAKASLYKHFSSKEDLAAAAMVRVMQRAVTFLEGLDHSARPIELLKAVARWTMEVQLAGEMPSLPSENSALRGALMVNTAYMDGLMQVSDRLGAWIEAAQADGSLNRNLPPIAVLYTLYARACDPVLGFLRASGTHSDSEIIDMVMISCFEGLNAR